MPVLNTPFVDDFCFLLFFPEMTTSINNAEQTAKKGPDDLAPVLLLKVEHAVVGRAAVQLHARVGARGLVKSLMGLLGLLALPLAEGLGAAGEERVLLTGLLLALELLAALQVVGLLLLRKQVAGLETAEIARGAGGGEAELGLLLLLAVELGVAVEGKTAAGGGALLAALQEAALVLVLHAVGEAGGEGVLLTAEQGGRRGAELLLAALELLVLVGLVERLLVVGLVEVGVEVLAALEPESLVAAGLDLAVGGVGPLLVVLILDKVIEAIGETPEPESLVAAWLDLAVGGVGPLLVVLVPELTLEAIGVLISERLMAAGMDLAALEVHLGLAFVAELTLEAIGIVVVAELTLEAVGVALIAELALEAIGVLISESLMAAGLDLAALKVQLGLAFVAELTLETVGVALVPELTLETVGVALVPERLVAARLHPALAAEAAVQLGVAHLLGGRQPHAVGLAAARELGLQTGVLLGVLVTDLAAVEGLHQAQVAILLAVLAEIELGSLKGLVPDQRIKVSKGKQRVCCTWEGNLHLGSCR